MRPPSVSGKVETGPVFQPREESHGFSFVEGFVGLLLLQLHATFGSELRTESRKNLRQAAPALRRQGDRKNRLVRLGFISSRSWAASMGVRRDSPVGNLSWHRGSVGNSAGPRCRTPAGFRPGSMPLRFP